MSLEATLRSSIRAGRRRLGSVRQEISCALYRRTVALPHPGAVVSFTFDDFPRTAYTEGGAILKSLGFRGTYYVAMGLMNVANHQGEHFRVSDLEAVARDGHEVASHTFSHRSSRDLDLQAFRADVKKGCSAIQEASGVTPSGNFAYPYGEATLAAKRAVGQDLTSCRGTVPGLNGRMPDLNLLRANFLYGDVDRLAAAEALVRENQRQQGWLIFYTHDVRRNPSAYGCTPELLEGVARIVRESKATVLTVRDALAVSTAATQGQAQQSSTMEPVRYV